VCTLIFGWRVAEEAPLLLAANRDEDPERPAEGPRVLRGEPRVVGGRDRRAGGTWLAIRDRRCVVGVLNRRGGDHASATRGAVRAPSRGLLALLVAAAGDGHPRALAAAARLLLRADPYAPVSLVVAGPEGAYVASRDGAGEVRVAEAGPGWHVLTHEELDDAREPRTRWLIGELGGFRPHSTDEAFDRLGDLLARHDAGAPAVCLHEGRMRTVSTARVALSPARARYLHGEGPACRATLTDHSHLIESP